MDRLKQLDLYLWRLIGVKGKRRTLRRVYYWLMDERDREKEKVRALELGNDAEVERASAGRTYV